MSRSVCAGVFVLLLSSAVGPTYAKERATTILYEDRATKVNTAIEEAGQLWITPRDLEQATGFAVKPQGVCREKLCFPLPHNREGEFLRKQNGTSWFNLTAFAQLVSQPFAHDEALSTWYFGLRADQRQGLSSLEAPDFTLPDMSGKLHSLSDYRGKKVLLLTWASW
jgi:hypothetical protein